MAGSMRLGSGGKEARQQAIQQRQRIGEVALVDDERRCDQDQVAARAERHALVECGPQQGSQWRRRLGPGRQRLARVAIDDEFEHGKQSVATADVADDRMPVGQPTKLTLQSCAQVARALDQALVAVRIDGAPPRASLLRLRLL